MLRREEAALLIACFARLFICTRTPPPNPHTAPAKPKRRSVHFRKHRKLPSRVGKSLSLPPRSSSLSLLPLPKFGILPPLLLARLFVERETEICHRQDKLAAPSPHTAQSQQCTAFNVIDTIDFQSTFDNVHHLVGLPFCRPFTVGFHRPLPYGTTVTHSSHPIHCDGIDVCERDHRR